MQELPSCETLEVEIYTIGYGILGYILYAIRATAEVKKASLHKVLCLGHKRRDFKHPISRKEYDTIKRV